MSVGLYRLLISIYGLILRIASLFHPKARLFVAGRKGLITTIQHAMLQELRPRLWMHCASLGEFEQGRPVLEQLKAHYPHYAIVLTFFSPSGYEVRKDYTGADYVFYLPLDHPVDSVAFIDAVQPAMALFVKYEFWYYYLTTLAQRRVPTLLLSALFRKDQIFFTWYGGLSRRMLRCFSQVFVQDDASKQLLSSILVDNVMVSGDTRFDRVIAAAEAAKPVDKIADFCQGSKVLVAGSTWPRDEQLLLQALPYLPADMKIVLVPHEVHTAHIQQIMHVYKQNAVLYSAPTDPTRKVLVVDSVGLLLRLYAHAHVAWIGGALDKDGVHNVPEAAVYGVPCAYGPIYHQFLEAQELIAAGGAVSLNSAEELVNWVKQMAVTEVHAAAANAARAYVRSKAGATRLIMHYVAEVLPRS